MKVNSVPDISDEKYLSGSMSYTSYIKLVTDLLAEHKVTGHVQSESLVAYTKLNVHRMHRIEKTMELLPEVKIILENNKSLQLWFVLSEGWCGDAAQTLPVLHKMSLVNPLTELRILLRDENADLMDQYLTNGKSRSIPKLIVCSASGEELFNWGPRPDYLQKRFMQMRDEGIANDVIKEEIHRWYANDRTHTTQREIGKLLQSPGSTL